jgi:hypothetical protein
MRSFAGIIRYDGEDVPEAWLQGVAGRCGGSSQPTRIVLDRSAAFVEYGRGRRAEATHPAGEGPVDSPTGEENGVFLFSGRIDNGDAAVAHAQWGADCAEHLLGEFALAHWDSRKRRLLLGRDRLGVRAVYYHQSETLFAFGTELRDLLALPFMPRDLRDESLVDFLRRDGSSPAGTTFYQSIRLLPSAHRLILDGAKAVVHQYWKPPEPLPATGISPTNCASW